MQLFKLTKQLLFMLTGFFVAVPLSQIFFGNQ